MHLRALILAVGAAGAVAACGSTASTGSSAPASGGANTITIKNFAFGPATLHVSTGTTVTWTNSDSTTHTTAADKSAAQQWDSGNLTPNTSYAVTFAKPGTYSFHCTIHNYMTGTVVVSG
ncbi:cupredoxin domain-containing protein [Candidatus Aeolococcus gillhamiae]|uniref:cupredoxin domain-containing protein n=1 Tax=Candidatus Aeolococcus gillhamiae TaxID=3127015 RepID=UPI0030781357